MRLGAIAAVVAIAGCATFHAGSPPGARSDATFVEVDGARIHYRELGSGDQTVVLVHGFGASLESWRGVHQALARRFRVIALDLPGFGLSGRPD